MDTVGVSDSSLFVSDVLVSADSLVDVAVLDDEVSLVSPLVEVLGSSASDDDGVEVADDSADSLALVGVVEGDSLAVVASVDVSAEGAALVPGAVVMGACEAVVTSASLGSAGATVVTGGATVVVGASTGACVSTGAGACVSTGAGACVTGGACVTAGAGASAGACGATSTGSGAETSGAGATTVVVGPLSSPGAAMAGAIPPVSAVREITTPVARTATTPRFEQNSRGAPTLIDSFISPDNCLAQERSPLPSQKVHR